MQRDPLETALRLRKRIVDEVRRDLAAAVAAETAAEATAREAEQAIENEAQRASDSAGGDDLVEAFAAWLPGGRHRAAQARAAQERLEAEVNRRRAELAACRTGVEVIETLLSRRRSKIAQDQARRSQQAIDEAASRTTQDPAL